MNLSSSQLSQRYAPAMRQRNYGCRILEMHYQGLRCVVLENASLRVAVAVDKGADIYEFLHKPSDTEFLLRTPLGLRATGPVLPSIGLREGAFLDYYEGGWQELFPAAGDFPCEYKGAQLGMHGEVALQPWSYRIEEDQPERITVQFSVHTLRTPFRLERTLRLQAATPSLQIAERISNWGDETMDFMWGHHPALGWPFLEEGCHIELPPCTVTVLGSECPPTTRLAPDQSAPWPVLRGRQGESVDLSRMPGPETKTHDFVFLHGFPKGWYRVVNPRLGLGFRLSWPPEIFRCLWLWKVSRGAPGFPWYGTTYNLALEPHSSFPPMLPKALEKGAQLTLAPGAALEVELTAEIESVPRSSMEHAS